MDNHIHKDVVEDEIKIAMFNSGYPGSVDYYSLEQGVIESSGWTKYGPDEVKYRFIGF
jgi:hypothetical protein